MSKDQQPSRTYLSQTDVPAFSLDQALRIPKALVDSYASKSARPLAVAQAVSMSPSSGPFRTLCGAAIAYGLTSGGYNAPEIALTPLGKRILKPTMEGDEITARREAMLRPKVIGDFLSRYDGQKLPKEQIGINVLSEMGVPEDRAAKTFQMIAEAATAEGLIREIKGEKYVDLSAVPQTAEAGANGGQPSLPPTDSSSDTTESLLPSNPNEVVAENVRRDFENRKNRRVYISHGKNRALIAPIKELLTFGKLEPVVSIERESAAIPIPEKVMNEMRGCGAAIIHVDDEQQLTDSTGNTHVVLNQNVLIEIGAAIALYGKRVIVLLKSGAKLPSNLQGLYYLEYTGQTLDVNDTIKLLKAINQMEAEATPA